jgi:AcrR family transcriptional regulator
MGEPGLKSDQKRRAILEAARRHFMAEGYAGAGMEAIAREAAVSTATLYSYFPSKTDLFKRVVEEAALEFSDRISRTTSNGVSGEEQLRAFALAYARFMADSFVRSVFRLVAAERRRFEPTAKYFFERGRSDFGGVLMGILTRLQAEGRLEIGKLSWAAGQLMGMIEHPTFMVPIVTGDDVGAERSLEQICDDAVETFMARYAAPMPRRSGEKSFANPEVVEGLASEF